MTFRPLLTGVFLAWTLPSIATAQGLGFGGQGQAQKPSKRTLNWDNAYLNRPLMKQSRVLVAGEILSVKKLKELRRQKQSGNRSGGPHETWTVIHTPYAFKFRVDAVIRGKLKKKTITVTFMSEQDSDEKNGRIFTNCGFAGFPTTGEIGALMLGRDKGEWIIKSFVSAPAKDLAQAQEKEDQVANFGPQARSLWIQTRTLFFDACQKSETVLTYLSKATKKNKTARKAIAKFDKVRPEFDAAIDALRAQAFPPSYIALFENERDRLVNGIQNERTRLDLK